MARIAAVATALPTNVYNQLHIHDAIVPMITTDEKKLALIRRLHAASTVATRHLARPIERYREPATFATTNDLFIQIGTELCERALRDALAQAGREPNEVDFIVFNSITGIAAPSIDALLVARLGLRPDIKRVPIFGLGCVAGAAGIARVRDYLRGHPNDIAVLVTVELCSLTFQREDDSTANMVATGLFGDGAAAVVMVGLERAASENVIGPDVIDTQSQLYPDTQEVLGFNATETGFRIVLTAQVAEVIEQNFGVDAAAFLMRNGLSLADIDTWIAHPGGPKVLESFQAALGLPERSFDNSWRSLAAVGNMSSVSVLHILESELAATAGPRTALLFALGPGVSAELVLLRWAAAEVHS